MWVVLLVAAVEFAAFLSETVFIDCPHFFFLDVNWWESNGADKRRTLPVQSSVHVDRREMDEKWYRPEGTDWVNIKGYRNKVEIEILIKIIIKLEKREMYSQPLLLFRIHFVFFFVCFTFSDFCKVQQHQIGEGGLNQSTSYLNLAQIEDEQSIQRRRINQKKKGET